MKVECFTIVDDGYWMLLVDTSGYTGKTSIKVPASRSESSEKADRLLSAGVPQVSKENFILSLF